MKTDMNKTMVGALTKITDLAVKLYDDTCKWIFFEEEQPEGFQNIDVKSLFKK